MRRRDVLIGGCLAAIPQAAASQLRRYQLAIVEPLAPVQRISHLGPFYRPLLRQLSDLGYSEGGNLTVHRLSAEGRADLYPELASRAVAMKPDVIFTPTNHVVTHLQRASSTVPIVAIMAEPVMMGLVASFARPGGNTTGVVPNVGSLSGTKRLALLKEIVPAMSKVGCISTTANWEGKGGEGLRQAADKLGLVLLGPFLRDFRAAEYERAVAAMVDQGAQGLHIASEAEHTAQSTVLAALALKFRLPSGFPFRNGVDAGGLCSYGTDFRDMAQRLARQIGLIFEGQNPAEIPLEHTDKYALILNVRTARDLGLEIPPAVLAQANEVIE